MTPSEVLREMREMREINSNFRVTAEWESAIEAAMRKRDAEIERLKADQQGPDGFDTWKDAAIDERVRRVKAEAEIEDKKASLDMMRTRLGQWETLLRQCREQKERLEARAALAEVKDA